MSAASAPLARLPPLPRDVIYLILSHLSRAELIPFRFIKDLRSAPRVLSDQRPKIAALITAHTTRAFLLWAVANLRINVRKAQPLVCQALARHGHLELLQYVRSLSPPFSWNSVTVTAAACGGHLATLQWLHANGLPSAGEARNVGAKRDDLNMFLWGVRQGSFHMATDEDISLAAVSSPAVLAWLLPRRKATAGAVYRAAEGGRVACMELLWKHAPDLVVACARECLRQALMSEHTELRRWLLATLPRSETNGALTWLLPHLISWHGCATLAELEADGVALDYNKVTCEAAKDLDTVKFLRARGVRWGENFYAHPGNRSLETVIWAHENGCPLNAQVVNDVGESGKMEAFRYLRDKLNDGEP